MQSFWDTKAKSYLSKFQRKRDEISRNYILQQLETIDPKFQTILEIGIGGADLLSAIKKRRILINYTGFDCTDAFIENARKLHPEAPVLKGDMRNLGCFSDDCFDLVYTRHTLEHIDYYEEALKEIVRVASRKVVIILFHPLQQQDQIIIKDQKHDVYNNYYGRARFIESLSGLVSNIKETIIKAREGSGENETILDCTL